MRRGTGGVPYGGTWLVVREALLAPCAASPRSRLHLVHTFLFFVMNIMAYYYLLLCSLRSAAACTKDSYGRGVGTVLDTCPDGYEKQGALCYPACPSDWQYG